VARLRLFASLILVLLLAFPVYAGNDSTGTVGGAFLKLGNGVRAPAMGGTFTAVADDATAISWNPAGIADLNSRQISMSYNMWLQSTSYSNVHYVHPLMPGHTLGASIFYLSYGEIMETTATARTGTGAVFSPSGTVATLSYASKIREDLSLGANFKLLNQSIDTYQESGTAVDLGLIFKDFWGMDFGFVVQNVGSIGGSDLPQTMKLGLSKDLLDDKLLIALDLNLPKDNNAIFSLGGEYQINQLLAVRAGYNTRSEEGSGGNLGMGLGLNISGFAVDYAYVPYGELGAAHRAGLRLEF
jgi:long-subunit fatty acid transport protein